MEEYQTPDEDHRGQYFPESFRDVNVEPAAYFYPHPCCSQPLLSSSSSSSHLSIKAPDRALSPSDNFSPASISAYLHSDYQCTTPSYKNYDVTEIRKEKSRDAARNRRGKENHEFLSLSRLLPLPGAITSQLDKASIVRLCISSLKLRTFSIDGDPAWSQPNSRHCNGEPGSQLVSIVRPARDAFDATFGSTILQAHDGFVAALSPEGNILYISETVSIYLGLSQVELTGSSIFEYIHEDDRVEFSEASGVVYDPSAVNLLDQEPGSTAVPPSLEPPSDSESEPAEDLKHVEHVGLKLPYRKTGVCSQRWRNGHRKTALCVRFRSTLTKRGVQMRYSGYRVLSLQIQSRYAAEESELNETDHYNKHSALDSGEVRSKLGYVVFATALPSLNINELRLDSLSVTTKMTLDLKILSCDSRLEALTGCTQDLLIGTSFYALCYGMDFEAVKDLHDDVLRKGQSLSSYYRLLNRTGGFSRVQTGAHLMTASKSPGEQQCIVAVHTFISEVESQQEPLVLWSIPVIQSSHVIPDKKPRSVGMVYSSQMMEENQPTLAVYPENGDFQTAALRRLQLDETSTSTNGASQREKNNTKKRKKSEKNQVNTQFGEAVTTSSASSSKRTSSKDPHSARKKTK